MKLGREKEKKNHNLCVPFSPEKNGLGISKIRNKNNFWLSKQIFGHFE